ncbi:MAG: hypothetical protein AAF696_08630, partial [Bacteroidota bacterium]
MQKINTQYLGIFLGALYGIIFRILCEGKLDASPYEFTVYSVSFLWVLPIVMGIIPIIFAGKEELESSIKLFFRPLGSVLLFFTIALASGLEDMLCILLLCFPFLLSAGLAGLIVGKIMRSIRMNKFYSFPILLLPFLFSPLENYLPDQKEHFVVKTEIEIEAGKEEIWKFLIEVPKITEEEYPEGFYNMIGVPRPLKSELSCIEGEEVRKGYFSEGLILYETISQELPNQ